MALLQSLWLGFYQSGNTYLPEAPEGWVKEIYDMVQWYSPFPRFTNIVSELTA